MGISIQQFKALQAGNHSRQPKHRKQKQEESIQVMVAGYLKLKYPGVIFRSDFAAGAKMTMGQSIRNKSMQEGRAYPDLFIAEPRLPYCGLFIELKRNREEIYLKTGKLSNNRHVQEQAAMLDRLREKGYKAVFACGFSEVVQVIDRYLGK